MRKAIERELAEREAELGELRAQHEAELRELRAQMDALKAAGGSALGATTV